MLKFLGRGSAFADTHNAAYFIQGNDLILIDCPATTFRKIRECLLDFETVYILVTHTHGDHSSGIGTVLQYVWFASYGKKKVTVVAPSEQVQNDLHMLLRNIEGCEKDWFDMTTADKLNKKWLVSAIATTHVKLLEQKCFGYHLKINDINVIYTGDTATLEPFIPLLKNGDYLYTEIAYAKSDVHLAIEDTLPKLMELAANGVIIYLMHLDNEQKIAENIKNTAIKLAPLVSCIENIKNMKHTEQKHLYFVRHGQTVWNVENKICGATDIPLTELGHQQAIQTGHEILEQKIQADEILYSPLSRAKDTALHISEITGIPAREEPRLTEQCFGRYEATARNGAAFQQAKMQFLNRYDGGESMLHLAQRIYNLLDDLKNDNKTYILVAHNGIARVVNSYFHEMTNEAYAAFGVKNCEILHYVY